MKSENTFSFAPLFRWVRRSAVVLLGTLLVLLLHAPLRAGAQGCPSLDTGDFTATLIAANSDCHTPARLTVTYRNAVAGFSAMAYSVSKNRTNYSTPVVTPRPGLPAVLPLDGWNEGDPIYIRAVATCGTRKLTVVLPKIVYHVKEAADVQATATITPAGGCEATGGAVSVHLSGVSGFSKAEFKLEKDGATPRHPSVPVGNLTARKPYEETLFFNLAPGRYTLRVRAVPDCVPSTPGEGWKDGAYEWEQPVDVEHFGVTATTIPTRGNCPGGVVIGASKVVGIARLKYELWKKGGMRAGTPPLQTANVVYPAFAHTFTGLPLGDYEVRATATDCDATATGSFVITQGELVHPKVSIIRHTYAGCAAGRLQVQLDGTTAACPASYRLTPTAGGTPKVLTDVATETAEFSGLAAGTYTLTTTYGGQTINTPVEIKTVTPGILKIKPTLAETYCSPTGAMEVTLVDGTLDESATLELSLDGTVVRSVNLNAGETTKTIEGLLPGGYALTLRTACGATVTTTAAIGMKNSPMISIYPEVQGDMDFCQPQPMAKVRMRIELARPNDDGDPEVQKSLIRTFLTGATYTVRDGDKVIASGPMPVEEIIRFLETNSAASMVLLLPLNDHPLSFSLQMPCGTPTIPALMKLNEFPQDPSTKDSAVKYPMAVFSDKSSCDKYEVRIAQRASYERENVTVKLIDNNTGRSLGEVTPPEEYAYNGSTFENVPPGDYYYEFWSDCPNAPHHRSDVFTLKNDEPEVNVNSTYAKGCEPTGSISYYYRLPSGVSASTKGKLYRADGSLVEEGKINQRKFEHLAPGKYKLVVVPAPQEGDNCTVDGFTREIEVTSHRDNPSGTPDYYAEEIQNLTATLGTFGTHTNTLSFDFVSIPGTHTLKVEDYHGSPITKTVTIPDNGNKTNKVHVTFNNLAEYATLTFPAGECGAETQRTYNLVRISTGKYTRAELQDALRVTNIPAIPGCRKGKIIFHSNLVAMGVPQRPTKIYLERSSYGGVGTIDSITSPNIITDLEIENEGSLTLSYYYDGEIVDNFSINESDFMGYPFLYPDVQTLRTLLGDKGFIKIQNTFAAPTDHVHIRIINNENGRVLHEETIVGTAPHTYEMVPGSYTVSYEALDGCYVGQTGEQQQTVNPATLVINVAGSSMMCANDGVIRVSLDKEYGNADLVNYEITPQKGGPAIQGQTTTPLVPKEFPGLEAGTYNVKATATILRGFDGLPHSYETTSTAYLSTPYTNPLSVRPDPVKGSPAITECGTGGAIGLRIQGSRSNKVKVFITETPSGPINPRKEITQNDNGSWGQNLAPGNYKLFVTDGCMDIIVPTATVQNSEFKAAVKPYECVSVDVQSPHSGKLNFSTIMSLASYDRELRSNLLDNVELQVVSPGSAPDETNWGTYDRLSYFLPPETHPYDYHFKSSTDRFDFRNGYDILYRFKNCPPSMKRVHQAPGSFKVCNPFRVFVYSVDSCTYEQFVINEYDADRPYRIQVRNDKTNQVIYDQVRTFPYKPNHGDIWENQFRYPYGGEYTMTITSINDPLIPPYVAQIKHKVIFKREFFITAGEFRGDKKMVSCTSANYRIGWSSGSQKCYLRTDVKVFDKATGTEVKPYFSRPVYDDGSQYDRSFMLRRNNVYVLKAYEDGQFVYSEDYTVKYDMPINYKHIDIDLFDKCHEPDEQFAPVSTNKEEDLNYIVEELPAGVKVYDKNLEYDDFLKILLHDNVNNRTYESHDISHFTRTRSSDKRDYPVIMVRTWNEIKAAGDTIKDVRPKVPVGTHTLEVLTSCGDRHTSTFNVTYAPSAVSKVSFTDVKYQCDGKLSFTPTGTAAFPDKSDPVNIVSYRLSDDKYTTYNWGDPAETYNYTGYVVYKLSFEDGSTCERSKFYDFSTTPLAFDKSSTVSFFCSGADKGEINVGLKGGHPPYTYELRTLDGLLVEKKTAPGVVTFEQGVLGSRYRIEATDDCGLTHIYQDVLLQDPASISGSMNRRVSYCEGAQGRLEAITFPGATYTWTRPDGSQSHDKVITFPATAANAGKYNVKIQLNSCNATLYGQYAVQVAQLTESTGAHTNRSCAGQSAVFAPPAPIAKLDGEDVDKEDLTYQWQYTKTPNDETSWKPIFGATDASVEYVAAYPGTYYLRRTTQLGECSAIGGVCTLTVDPGITVTMSAGERRVVIDHKNPFLLTAGIVSGPAARTYQWQRSLDGKQWSDIAGATEVTYTETQRLSSVVYYRRIVRSGTCETKGEPITVVFKRRYPAMINPQVRQRVDQHW